MNSKWHGTEQELFYLMSTQHVYCSYIYQDRQYTFDKENVQIVEAYSSVKT